LRPPSSCSQIVGRCLEPLTSARVALLAPPLTRLRWVRVPLRPPSSSRRKPAPGARVRANRGVSSSCSTASSIGPPEDSRGPSGAVSWQGVVKGKAARRPSPAMTACHAPGGRPSLEQRRLRHPREGGIAQPPRGGRPPRRSGRVGPAFDPPPRCEASGRETDSVSRGAHRRASDRTTEGPECGRSRFAPRTLARALRSATATLRDSDTPCPRSASPGRRRSRISYSVRTESILKATAFWRVPSRIGNATAPRELRDHGFGDFGSDADRVVRGRSAGAGPHRRGPAGRRLVRLRVARREHGRRGEDGPS
jgi:hypothetical protein